MQVHQQVLKNAGVKSGPRLVVYTAFIHSAADREIKCGVGDKKKVNKWLRNPSSGAGGIQSGVTRLQINAIYTACIASRRETNSVVDSATR